MLCLWSVKDLIWRIVPNERRPTRQHLDIEATQTPISINHAIIGQFKRSLIKYKVPLNRHLAISTSF